MLKTVVSQFFCFGLFLISLFLLSCENDIKDINRIASLPVEEAVDISKHVEVTYSDSARVKAVLTAPEMRVYHDSTNNYEFQKGVQIIFYDANLNETQRVNSDYAIHRANLGLYEFRRNVVVKMADGSVIKTEELFYEDKEGSPKRYYNTVPITFFMKDGRGDFRGASFTSDTDFKVIEGDIMTGHQIIVGDSPFPGFGQ